MADQEPITARKFFGGAVQPKTGIKALAFLPWLLLFVFIGWCIYIAVVKPWINPVKTQTQSTQIEVKPGGTLNLTQQQKQEAPKKRWIVFVEPYLSQGSKQKMETGIRVGVRREW
jgi:hypothetical protein